MQDVGTFLARVPKQVDEILKSQQVKAVASKEKAVKAPTAIEKAIPEPKAVDKGIQVNGFKIEEDVDEPTTQEDDEVDQLEADSCALPFSAPTGATLTLPPSKQSSAHPRHPIPTIDLASPSVVLPARTRRTASRRPRHSPSCNSRRRSSHP